MEIWKDIVGFENKYQVSNYGNIKSLNYNNTKKEKILIPKINKKNGILEVTLNKNNKHHYFMLNRIVIETFTNKKLNKNVVIMYKDNNKQNCSLSNLYLITRGERQEITYDLDNRFKPKYNYYGKILSTKQIAKINNINPETIRQRIRELYWNIYEAAEIPKAIYKSKKEG